MLRNDAGGGSFLTGFDGDLGEDARSFAARQQDSYGILQLSFEDTYAGTAAGAFALTENSLYTTEAWRIFLESLDADGILSVTRYYFSAPPDQLPPTAAPAATYSGMESAPRSVSRRDLCQPALSWYSVMSWAIRGLSAMPRPGWMIRRKRLGAVSPLASVQLPSRLSSLRKSCTPKGLAVNRP